MFDNNDRNLRFMGRCLFGWINIIIISITILVVNTSSDKEFFRIGPSSDFKIMGIEINNISRYLLVISYSFVNSVFRAIVSNYLHPWIINNVQDESKDKSHLNHIIVYEINTYIVLYHWFDWLLYMNILLSQIDMMIVEIIGDLIISHSLSAYYLRSNKRLDNETKYLQLTMDIEDMI